MHRLLASRSHYRYVDAIRSVNVVTASRSERNRPCAEFSHRSHFQLLSFSKFLAITCLRIGASAAAAPCRTRLALRRAPLAATSPRLADWLAVLIAALADGICGRLSWSVACCCASPGCALITADAAACTELLHGRLARRVCAQHARLAGRLGRVSRRRVSLVSAVAPSCAAPRWRSCSALAPRLFAPSGSSRTPRRCFGAWLSGRHCCAVAARRRCLAHHAAARFARPPPTASCSPPTSPVSPTFRSPRCMSGAARVRAQGERAVVGRRVAERRGTMLLRALPPLATVGGRVRAARVARARQRECRWTSCLPAFLTVAVLAPTGELLALCARRRAPTRRCGALRASCLAVTMPTMYGEYGAVAQTRWTTTI
jgi:hypothetical protein